MFVNQTIEADGSFVKISAKEAKNMAEDTLQWIKKERTARKEEAILADMKRLDSGFWHKLFRMKPHTREDAIASLDDDPWDFDYHFSKLMYHKSEDSARRILNACNFAEEIYISTEDLRRIA